MDTSSSAAVDAAREAMDRAYGAWTGPDWAPAAFAEAHSHRGRYLWTDAFGVCNYCSLYLETGDTRYLQQAEALVSAVHGTLGFTRDGKNRLGGATDDHPTKGGLRIGKADAGGPDGDGQYLHYLTKWAFALLQVSAATDDSRYLIWALELAEGTFHKFLCLPGGPGGASSRRLCWKMDAALSRPLVSSTGNLDALDALVSWTLLARAAERALGDEGGAGRLAAERRAAATLVAPWWRGYSSDDPLDLGESLWLSHWFVTGDAGSKTARLTNQCAMGDTAQARDGGAAAAGASAGERTAGWEEEEAEDEDGVGLVDLGRASDFVAGQALRGLEGLWEEGYFGRPRRYRLGFRELGATLGVQALISRVPELPSAKAWAGRVAGLHAAWGGDAMTERDCDITPVMWAASVLPRVWLKG